MLAEKNPYIGSAYQHLQVISQEKQKRLEYEAREKAVRDYNQGLLEAEERGVKLGLEQGIQLGIQQGTEQGVERINRLNVLLLRDNRYDDLLRSANDREFQRQFIIRYGI